MSRRAPTPAGRPARQRTIYLATPWAPMGGGMYRVADYLMQSQARSPASSDGGGRGEGVFRPLETRGGGSAAWSMIVILQAMLIVLRDRLRGRVAGLHINVAERLSLLRKGLLVVLGRLIGVPTVLHLHAAQLPQNYLAMSAPKRVLTRWMFGQATSVIVLGDSARRFVVDVLGVPAGRVQVVPNGVPGPAVVPQRTAAAGRLRLLFVGNLSERKGVSDLLAAVAEIAAGPRRPALELTLIGGGDVDAYRQQAAERGIADITRFAGWQSQQAIADAMATADALVLPSWDEGLPLVILEALAHALPVLCTPVGEIPQNLTDDHDACFVPPGDQAALAAAIRRLAEDPALRQRIGRTGRQLYEARYNLERFFDRIADVHREAFGVAARAELTTLPPLPQSVPAPDVAAKQCGALLQTSGRGHSL